MGVSEQHFLILSATGGSFRVAITTPSDITSTQIDLYDGTSHWDDIYLSDANFASEYIYKGCSGI